MAILTSDRARLWRYNYGILLGSGYWVLVLPIAASQVVTLWMMAMAGDFRQVSATRIGEMMMPVLGAFLGAHCLAPEYRSRVGSVLVSKPVSLNRVVMMRLALAMLAAILLTAVTLFICHIGLQPIDVWTPLLAGVPSLWFLSALALTFATAFRSAFGGFGVAAGLWALDLSVGYGINPYLSMQGLSASLEQDPLSDSWPVSKIVLVVFGAALVFIHGRMLRRLCQPSSPRDLMRFASVAVVAIIVYSATGAMATLVYAYRYRGELAQPDEVWLRRQMQVYAPVPAARFFGPAFAAYMGQPTGGSEVKQAGNPRVRQLEQATQRWPRSVWADSIAFALARNRYTSDPAQAAEDYFRVAERFPRSPFAPKALAAVIKADTGQISGEVRLIAARQLIRAHSDAPEVEAAANQLLELYPSEIEPAELEKAALFAARAAVNYRRPRWYVTAARAQLERDDVAAARTSASRAQQVAQELIEQQQRAGDAFDPLRQHAGEIGAAKIEAEQILAQLDASSGR